MLRIRRNLDWKLDLTLTIFYYNSQCNSISYTRQFIIHAQSPLGLLSFTSPLVSASNGGRSSFWVPNYPCAIAAVTLDLQRTH
jgi:hypothetical protein